MTLGEEAATGRIAGNVVGSDARPVGEARVLVADGPTHHDIAALTDELGAYRFDDLLPGVYTILVNVGDRPPLTRTVHVEAGRTARLDVLVS